MYNAVGIDVSKGKSTVAVLQPAGVIIRKPFNVDVYKRQSQDCLQTGMAKIKKRKRRYTYMDMCYDGALVLPSSYAVMDEEE